MTLLSSALMTSGILCMAITHANGGRASRLFGCCHGRSSNKSPPTPSVPSLGALSSPSGATDTGLTEGTQLSSDTALLAPPLRLLEEIDEQTVLEETLGCGQMTIYLQNPSFGGVVEAVDVPADATVADLSMKYVQRTGLSGKYSIVSQGKTLDSRETLADAGIGAESSVEVKGDVFAENPGITLSNS